MKDFERAAGDEEIVEALSIGSRQIVSYEQISAARENIPLVKCRFGEPIVIEPMSYRIVRSNGNPKSGTIDRVMLRDIVYAAVEKPGTYVEAFIEPMSKNYYARFVTPECTK